MAVMFHSILTQGIFLNINVSQGSVATCLRCGRTCKFTTESVSEKNCENQLVFDEFAGKSIDPSGSFFDSKCRNISPTIAAELAILHV